jgi:hypothetical protein
LVAFIALLLSLLLLWHVTPAQAQPAPNPEQKLVMTTNRSCFGSSLTELTLMTANMFEKLVFVSNRNKTPKLERNI